MLLPNNTVYLYDQSTIKQRTIVPFNQLRLVPPKRDHRDSLDLFIHLGLGVGGIQDELRAGCVGNVTHPGGVQMLIEDE